MKNRRLEGWPGALIAASDWPGRFPIWSKAVCTSAHYHQSDSGTSTGSGVFVDLVIVRRDVCSALGGYHGHCAVGDLRRQMTGISNICHLRHDLRRCDCAIKSFG